MTTLTFTGGTINATYTVPGTHIGYGVFKYPSFATDQIFASSGTAAQIVDATIIGSTITITAIVSWGGTASASEIGLCIIDSTKSGFSVLCTGLNAAARKEVSGSPGAAIGSSVVSGLTTNGDYTIGLTWNKTTGAYTFTVGGANKLTNTYNDITTNMRGGVQNYNDNSTHTLKQLDTTLGGGTTVTLTSPVSVGGTGYTATTTGLGTVTTITNGTVTATGTNSFTYSMNAWANNVVYLAIGAGRTQTVGDGTLTASSTATINPPTGYTTVDVASIDRGTWSLGKDANIQNGDQISLPTAAGTLNANTTLTDYVFGTYTLWRRDQSDGKMYASTLTISNSGISVTYSKNHFIGLGIGIGL